MTIDRRLEAAVFLMGFAVVALIALLTFVDVWFDLGQGASRLHVSAELTLAVVGVMTVGGGLWALRATRRRMGRIHAENQRFEQMIEASREESERLASQVRSAREGLSTVIDRQFGAWALTPAEREVATLLLKGLSHREIADIRKVGQATVRQQAQSVYRKAGLSGRHDLAAFFLEDLLVPEGGPAP